MFCGSLKNSTSFRIQIAEPPNALLSSSSQNTPRITSQRQELSEVQPVERVFAGDSFDWLVFYEMIKQARFFILLLHHGKSEEERRKKLIFLFFCVDFPLVNPFGDTKEPKDQGVTVI